MNVHALTPAAMTAVILTVTAAAAPPEPPVFDVPRMDGITLDGQSPDWGERGFHVGIVAGEAGQIWPAEDLNATLRLGWNDQGLLLLLTVNDDFHTEDENIERLWQKDSVEIFLASRLGGTDVYQVVIAPGLDARFPEPRQYVNDHRRSEALKSIAVTAKVARARTPTGYTIETLLPWAPLAVRPALTTEVAFQIYVNDVDGDTFRKKVIWYPKPGAHSDTTLMHRLRLSEKPGAPVRATASGKYELFRRTVIQIAGEAALAGQPFRVEQDKTLLATGALVAAAGRAQAQVILPMPPQGRPYGTLAISLTNTPLASVELADADEQRARAFMEAELRFPRVFSGEAFPTVDFAQPSLVESLIGRYSVKCVFYDRDRRQVVRAAKPGRYGAVIEITGENGRTFRRYRTLFRSPEFVRFWEGNRTATLRLPKELGIAPTGEEAFSNDLSQVLWDAWTREFDRDNGTAPLLAAMFETPDPAPPASERRSASELDRQYWVNLKRDRSGAPERKFVCPARLEGKEARVLREGTATEAGMKTNAADRIDAVCRAWAADSDQAFIACVARHGVVVLHKAYGEREGQPMTVRTRSWVASITKLIAATSMMTLVDQGLVGLDDPVDKFIPALRGIPVERPVTVRHLYTHTAGMWGHWGDDMNDFDEVVAGYYPYLKVGKAYEYNGMSFSMGGKIIEAVTGEALPVFYRNHLLGPLGCDSTEISGSSGDARSTALDLAKIGQMLLNRGAYGPHRFFGEETFGKMPPRRLTDILGGETTAVHGIGTMAFVKEGLGTNTFGYGSATMCTFRVDPDRDLVITMTRNAPGRNFGQYYPKFITAIVESIEPGNPR